MTVVNFMDAAPEWFCTVPLLTPSNLTPNLGARLSPDAIPYNFTFLVLVTGQLNQT